MIDNKELPKTTDIEKMGIVFLNILKSAAIQNLVVIDDYYAVDKLDIEQILGLIQADKSKFESVLSELKSIEQIESDFISNIVRKAWRNPEIKQQLQELCVDESLHEEDLLDVVTMDVLKQLLNKIPTDESIKLHKYSSSDWEKEMKTVLQEDPNGHGTLVLIDRNFKRENKSEDYGLTLIAGLIEKHKEIHCALVTHTVECGQELCQWQELALNHHLDEHRFIVISKTRLNNENPDIGGFLHLLRLAILSGPLKKLREHAKVPFSQALLNAQQSLSSWNVYDFDEAVFGSSRDECVWEGDTLMRIVVSSFIQDAQKLVRQDTEFIRLIDFARKTSKINIPDDERNSWPEIGKTALSYQRSEYYIAGEQINEHFLPIETGDIFDRGDDKERYLLLAQPCDLMVRGGLGRSYDDKFQRMLPLCLIKPDPSKIDNHSYKLKWWDESTGKPSYVHFSIVHLIIAATLDLCVLNKNGNAVFNIHTGLPKRLSPSWEEYAKKLLLHYKRQTESTWQLIEAFNDQKCILKGQQKTTAIQKAIPCCSNTGRFKATVNKDELSVNLRRVGRINQQFATDILRAFAQYQSRTAVDQPIITERIQQRILNPK